MNFFLGFSPEGLRAWSVESDHVAEGNRHDPLPQDAEVEVTVETIAPGELQARIAELRDVRVRTFARDLLDCASSAHRPLTLAELAERTDAYFGLEQVSGLLGLGGVESLLPDDYELRNADVGQFVVRIGETVAGEETRRGDSKGNEIEGYVTALYTDRDLISVATLNDGTWLVPYEKFNVADQEKLERDTPVILMASYDRNGPNVIEARTALDRVFVTGQGLLDRGSLLSMLKSRHVRLAGGVITPDRLLEGIFPRSACYALLQVHDFKQLVRLSVEDIEDVDVGQVTRPTHPKRQAERGVKSGRAASVGVTQSELAKLAAQIIVELDQGAGVSMEKLGQAIRSANPDWKSELASLGYRKLTSFLRASGDYEIAESETPNAIVRRRQESRH